MHDDRLEAERLRLQVLLDDEDDVAEFVDEALRPAARDAGVDDLVILSRESAATAYQELDWLIEASDHPTDEFGDAMTPLARARQRIVDDLLEGEDGADHDTVVQVLDVIDAVGEETGAETAPVDPFTDAIFEAHDELGTVLGRDVDEEGER